MSEQMVKSLGLAGEIQPWEMGPVKTANGSKLEIKGVITITAMLGDAEVTYDMIVAETLSRGMIIGKDVLGQVGAVLDLKHDTITLDGCKPTSLKKRVMETMEIGFSVMEVFPLRDTVIPPNSEMRVQLRVDQSKY